MIGQQLGHHVTREIFLFVFKLFVPRKLVFLLTRAVYISDIIFIAIKIPHPNIERLVGWLEPSERFTTIWYISVNCYTTQVIAFDGQDPRRDHAQASP